MLTSVIFGSEYREDASMLYEHMEKAAKNNILFILWVAGNGWGSS